jgi:hypothetical protein
LLQVLVEQSLLGWKEFELEVMRDMKDNVVIICSIENVDPMGVHTGDSITIAPAQTLTDKEYQRLRDAAVAIIREMGVETGVLLTTQQNTAHILAFKPPCSRVGCAGCCPDFWVSSSTSNAADCINIAEDLQANKRAFHDGYKLL